MTLGGWKSVAMVLRYAHVNVSNLAPGVIKLGENTGTAEAGNSVPSQTGQLRVIAHNLAKVGVEGSNPFARSSEINYLRDVGDGEG